MLRLGMRLVRAGAAGVGFGFLVITGFAWWAATAAHAGNGSVKDDDIIIVDTPIRAWHGCYLGASAGANIDDTSASFGAPFTGVSHDNRDGLALGGYVGCNLDTGLFILGVEGDINTASEGPDRFGSARLRLGLPIAARTMIYGTGGYAFAKQQYVAITGINRFTQRDTVDGVAYGGGIEHQFGGSNTIRLEAIHYDYSTHRTASGGGFVDADQSHTVVRVGVAIGLSNLMGSFYGGGGTDPDVVQ